MQEIIEEQKKECLKLLKELDLVVLQRLVVLSKNKKAVEKIKNKFVWESLLKLLK